jgi:hypothetical protein
MITISITFRWNDKEVLPGVLRSALEAKWRAYSVREALREVPFASNPIPESRKKKACKILIVTDFNFKLLRLTSLDAMGL